MEWASVLYCGVWRRGMYVHVFVFHTDQVHVHCDGYEGGVWHELHCLGRRQLSQRLVRRWEWP